MIVLKTLELQINPFGFALLAFRLLEFNYVKFFGFCLRL